MQALEDMKKYTDDEENKKEIDSLIARISNVSEKIIDENQRKIIKQCSRDMFKKRNRKQL